VAGSLEEIYSQIMAGQPATLTTAGTNFKSAADAVDKLPDGIGNAVKGGTGEDKWTGPGSEAFQTYATTMGGEITTAAAR
jgi:hypothetical protein